MWGGDWTEFPSNPSPVSRDFFVFSSGVFEVLESDLFQDNFMMAFYFFGGVNLFNTSVVSRCGLYKEQEMLPLLSCDSGMTALLMHK